MLDGLELDDLAGLAAELEALREELGEEYVQARVIGLQPAAEHAKGAPPGGLAPVCS